MPNTISRVLIPLFFAMLAAALPAQVTVTPGGGNVAVGSTIVVENLGNRVAHVFVCVLGEPGTPAEVGAGRKDRYIVPNLPIGTTFELKTIEANGTVKTYTFRVTS